MMFGSYIHGPLGMNVNNFVDLWTSSQYLYLFQ